MTLTLLQASFLEVNEKEAYQQNPALHRILKAVKCYGKKPPSAGAIRGFISGGEPEAGIYIRGTARLIPCLQKIGWSKFYKIRISEQDLQLHYKSLSGFKSCFREKTASANNGKPVCLTIEGLDELREVVLEVNKESNYNINHNLLSEVTNFNPNSGDLELCDKSSWHQRRHVLR